MSVHEDHPFHMVNKRPRPFTGAIGAIVTLVGLIKWVHQYDATIWRQTAGDRSNYYRINYNSMMTRRDPGRNILRITTKIVTKGLRWGIILFIVSEVLFFLSFFWAFFHTRLPPTIELGSPWPPAGIQPFNTVQVPLINTAILLASGVAVTWAHHGLLENNATQAIQGVFFTVLLGL